MSDPFGAYRRSYVGALPTLRQARLIRCAILRRQRRAEALGLYSGFAIVVFMVVMVFLVNAAMEQRASDVPADWFESRGGSGAGE